jgi:hypothetical protein
MIGVAALDWDWAHENSSTSSRLPIILRRRPCSLRGSHWNGVWTLTHVVNLKSQDLPYMAGAELFRLWQYRIKCTTVAKGCINRMILGNNDAPPFRRAVSALVNIGQYDTKELQSMPRWWHRHFIYRAADLPSPKIIADRRTFESGLKVHCMGRRLCCVFVTG